MLSVRMDLPWVRSTARAAATVRTARYHCQTARAANMPAQIRLMIYDVNVRCHRVQRPVRVSLAPVKVVVWPDDLRPIGRRRVPPNLGDHGVECVEVVEHRLGRPVAADSVAAGRELIAELEPEQPWLAGLCPGVHMRQD